MEKIKAEKKMVMDNITTEYRKCSEIVLDDINSAAKVIAKNLKLDDRIEKFSTKNAFITMKDHKENFNNNPRCRLINPSKTEIGIISKAYLDSINTNIRKSTNLNQWKNTKEVITWFRSIENKKNSRFIQFDIINFYPSITESLLRNAFDYAKTITTISQEVIETILHARRSVLYNSKEIWVKKGNPDFDVTMGSYDGAEVCELIGLYMMNLLSIQYGEKSIGLYRDDGLACFTNMPGTRLENIKKNICKIFKDNNLSITINACLKVVDFLDVTLNLEQESYYPFKKPNSEPLYINRSSNHPNVITKQIPNMVSTRISSLSCSEDHFNQAKGHYNTALRKSGFTEGITFSKPSTSKRKRSRQRKITWFNPPFSSHVQTNVGRCFINIIKKHFKPKHKYYKIFNTNTIKTSYSCMPNMGNIIRNNNTRLLQGEKEKKDCNCRIRGKLSIGWWVQSGVQRISGYSEVPKTRSRNMWVFARANSRKDTTTTQNLSSIKNMRKKQNCQNLYGPSEAKEKIQK